MLCATTNVVRVACGDCRYRQQQHQLCCGEQQGLRHVKASEGTRHTWWPASETSCCSAFLHCSQFRRCKARPTGAGYPGDSNSLCSLSHPPLCRQYSSTARSSARTISWPCWQPAASGSTPPTHRKPPRRHRQHHNGCHHRALEGSSHPPRHTLHQPRPCPPLQLPPRRDQPSANHSVVAQRQAAAVLVVLRYLELAGCSC